MKPFPYTPDNDGVDHINVYSGGRTQLGQALTNFSRSPFQHPEHGHFASVEGYWYWLKSGKIHQHLRRLYGASAKSAGVKVPIVEMDPEVFHREIQTAIECKIRQNDELRNMFLKCTHPFAHYYVYGSKVIPQPKHDWQMKWLDELRDRMRTEYGVAVVAEETPPVAES